MSISADPQVSVRTGVVCVLLLCVCLAADLNPRAEDNENTQKNYNSTFCCNSLPYIFITNSIRETRKHEDNIHNITSIIPIMTLHQHAFNGLTFYILLVCMKLGYKNHDHERTRSTKKICLTKRMLLLLLLISGVNLLNPGPSCSICGKKQARRLIIQCDSCKHHFHRTCLDTNIYTPDHFKCCQTKPWTCDTCRNAERKCVVCKLVRGNWILLKCSLCNEKYHRVCVKEDRRKCNTNWICKFCVPTNIPTPPISAVSEPPYTMNPQVQIPKGFKKLGILI